MNDFHQSSVIALPLRQSHISLLVPGANQPIALRASNSFEYFNNSFRLADSASIKNLTSPLNPTGVTLFSVLLTPQIISKGLFSCFIRLNMLIKRFMGNWKLCRKLLGPKLLSNADKGGFKSIRINDSGIKTTYAQLLNKSIGLLWSVPKAPFVPSNHSRIGRLALAKILGNSGAIQSLFNEAKNLISFSLAEVFIGRGYLTVQVKRL